MLDPSMRAFQDDDTITIWGTMKGSPRSKEFDDVYFSAKDGLAETRYVFLEGNGLHEGVAGKDVFRVVETGFGTGLSFLAVWDLFLKARSEGQKLHFISVEKYPLSRGEIDAALSHFGEIDGLRAQLVSAYPDDAVGVFEHDFGDVCLTVHFGDVVDGLAQIDGHVDAWFLDGFKPASNPEMWRTEVFEQVARLSGVGTTFATFTAAGFVRRAMGAIGFDVKRIKGYGWKRHMSVGIFGSQKAQR